jgi:phosphatidylinositol alpha-mannosyltransferase
VRIGLFAPYDLARPGGVTTHIRAQARALRARGHEVRVFGPASAPLDHGEIALSGSVPIVFGGTEAGLGLDPFSARRVARLFRDERFDVVHVHEPLTPMLPWFVLRHATAPVVGTFHVHREQGHRLYPIGRPLLARLMRRVAHRVAVSDAARGTVADHFPGNYDIVPNGIDLDMFLRPYPRPRELDADDRTVLFVGRLEPRKGLEHLVRAMAHVQARVVRARLTVVGDGPERASLEALARSEGVDVRFLGRVRDDALPAYFQWTDLVCSPATGGESFGIVLLEAMACGTPVVATRIEGYEELVGRSGCGRLVPPGDAEALATAICELLEREPERRAYGARGLAFARAYDWNAIAERLERIYQTLSPGQTAHATTVDAVNVLVGGPGSA